jgi:hypothetical protein
VRHPERPVRVDYFTAETLEYAESAVFLDQELFTLRPQRLCGELAKPQRLVTNSQGKRILF